MKSMKTMKVSAVRVKPPMKGKKAGARTKPTYEPGTLVPDEFSSDAAASRPLTIAMAEGRYNKDMTKDDQLLSLRNRFGAYVQMTTPMIDELHSKRIEVGLLRAAVADMTAKIAQLEARTKKKKA